MTQSLLLSEIFSEAQSLTDHVLGTGAGNAIIGKVKSVALSELQSNPALSENELQTIADKQINYVFGFFESKAPREAATLIELAKTPVDEAVDLAVQTLYADAKAALSEATDAHSTVSIEPERPEEPVSVPLA
jgi:hypothetical protein